MIGLFDKPMLGPSAVDLWPYQEEAVAAVGNEFRKGVRRTLISMATGSGKTIVAAAIVRRCVESGHRVLFLAHTDELIQQTAAKFDLVGIEPAIEQAGQHARALWRDPDAVVGSVATVARPERLISWPEDYFDYVIVDEGHRALADSYKRIMSHFRSARVLVMTATPVRTDEQALGYICETLAYKFTILDAWDAGRRDGRQYICDLKIVKPELGIDPKALKRKKRDFTDREYEDRIAPMVEMIANEVRQKVGDLRSIQFWPTIRLAQIFAAAQNQWYPSDAVWGEDPVRDAKIKLFRSGEMVALNNMNLFTEGFDLPECNAAVLGRNTDSWSMMLQQIGRTLRAGKPHAVILDLFKITEKFGAGSDPLSYLIQPIDIEGPTGFDGEIDGIRKIMAEILAREPELTLLTAKDQAEDEYERRKKTTVAVRLSIAERDINVHEESYLASDVLGDSGTVPVEAAKRASTFEPATERMVNYLLSLGYTGKTANLSKASAGVIIGKLKAQKEAGVASYGQRVRLIGEGVPVDSAREMPKTSAEDFLDQCARRREEVYGRRRSRP